MLMLKGSLPINPLLVILICSPGGGGNVFAATSWNSFSSARYILDITLPRNRLFSIPHDYEGYGFTLRAHGPSGCFRGERKGSRLRRDKQPASKLSRAPRAARSGQRDNYDVGKRADVYFYQSDVMRMKIHQSPCRPEDCIWDSLTTIYNDYPFNGAPRSLGCAAPDRCSVHVVARFEPLRES